ncbi:hypothetical protein H4582DRAFT_2096493 [Lactarius indigo]|nr:hypothetical protein H4582DRAFT_2096493 [Lactarius indigo]
MDSSFPFPSQYSQRQSNGTGGVVVNSPGTHGDHTAGSHRGTDRPNVIATASEQMLEQNGFYVRLQYNSMKQKEEIIALQESNSELKKEIELLKERNQTYREIIDGSITKDSDSQQTVSVQSKGNRRVFSLANPPPNPKLEAQEDHPEVQYWKERTFKDEAKRRRKQGTKGETDGDASMVLAKRRRGRPAAPAKSDSTELTDNGGHFYLEYHDGTLVSSDDIALLSRRARMIWMELGDVGLAPPTFGQITNIAWDFYWRSILAYPEFQFLLLCDDGMWKLRQWSTRSYSTWALNHGVREAKPKTAGALDNPELIQMDPIGDEDSDKVGNSEPPSPVMQPMPSPSATPSTTPASVIADPFAPTTSPSIPNTANGTHPSPRLRPLTPHCADLQASPTNGDTRPTDNAPSPINSPSNNSPSDTALGQSPSASGNSRGPNPTTPDLAPSPTLAPSPAPAPSPTPVDTNDAGSVDELSQPNTDGIRGNDVNPMPMLDAAATTPSDTERTTSALPLQDVPADTSGTTPTTNTGPSNPRPEGAKTDSNKKRKSNDSVPPGVPTKKQKSSDAPAIPTQANTIRNICMRHWNQLQPGGQGTTAHFDAYYKGLSDAEKEPFKKEMYIGRGATRKANAAANKGTATLACS